ncbi:MAG: hypothetical protein QOG67_1029 [Verrucomicrobiota bacterium]|jgi:hypothetical protein
MKKSSPSIAARTTLSVLFFTSSLVLVILALSTPGTHSAPTRKSLAKGAQSAAIASFPPAPVDSANKLGFENFEGPGVLTPVTTSSQGQPVATVEYVAHDAGEPSIGVNWNTNVTAFQSDLQTLFVTFDDSCTLGAPKATWVNRAAPTSQGVDQDPIGFVDRITGRTFAAQLTLTSPTCKTSYTDDDGLTWTPTAGFGIGSGIDHQTIGGGPYHSPVPTLPTPYQHAFYYCSQLPAAGCARSDDGGLSFGPVVEIDPVADAHCVGIHGHVKVGPDGTVYVPTCNCDGQGSVIASEDNGITWTIRHVPGTNSTLNVGGSGNIIDAQVGVDDNNQVYFAMANAPNGFVSGSNPIVATSNDHGQTWQNIYDIGASMGVQNIEFPYVAAADSGRAAVAFLGTTRTGDPSANGFTGVWHLYVAATFNGGASWTTTDVTPNDPMQRGCIWNKGGANICRNLLDFIGASVDKQGRIEVAYVDGCPDGECAQAISNPARFTGNSYTARGVIARQSSGRRLVANFDPVSPTSAPGMPSITERRLGRAVHLSWSDADDGNSPITGYQIFRGVASDAETLLTTVPGSQLHFDDLTATDITQTYYYKVVAVNAVGSSCPNNEISAPYVGDGCTQFIVQKTPPGHPEQTTEGQTPPSLAIDYVAVAEPPGTSNFKFILKATSLATVPPNSRWRIVWNSESAMGQQFYAGMRTDANSAATFEFGHIATAVVGLVVGVPTETKDGDAAAGSNMNPDGTITVLVPKSAVGNPQPGDLLGAVNGRTFTGDTPESGNLERSNALMDHTFAKAQRDNGHPAATYTVLGSANCEGGIVPLSAVSSKTHDSLSPPFTVDLPLSGKVGIECRKGQPNAGDHQVIVTFPGPVTLTSASVPPGKGTVSAAIASGNQVFVNLTGVPDGQTIPITLGINDGTNIGNVVVPMGVLLGDTNADGNVDGTDVSQTKAQSGKQASNTGQTFREDVNLDGFIDGTDVSFVKSRSGGHLAP